ncbi:MAG: hypothetical protein ABJV68_20275 [Paracoccaceae bacterium]
MFEPILSDAAISLKARSGKRVGIIPTHNKVGLGDLSWLQTRSEFAKHGPP